MKRKQRRATKSDIIVCSRHQIHYITHINLKEYILSQTGDNKFKR